MNAVPSRPNPTNPVDTGFSFAYVADSVGRQILADQHCGRYCLGPSDLWFCVQTNHPGCDLLARAGIPPEFRPYLPLYVRRSRRRGAFLDSLFPGYFFVAFDPTVADWGAVCRVRGVRRLLGRPYAPAPVRQSFVAKLIELSGEDGFHDRDGVLPKLIAEMAPIPVGEAVVVTMPDGSSVESIVEWSDERRVGLLMWIMGAEREIEVGRRSVRLANSKPDDAE